MKTPRKLYFVLLAIFFVLPLIQMQCRIIPMPSLKGVQRPLEIPPISIHSVSRGEFQKAIESWFARNFGLRELWIRFHNQLLYSFLRTTPLESTIDVGKGRQLFEKNYCEYYLGMTKPDIDSLPFYIKRLQHLQKLLEARNIPLIMCFSPSKAAMYPQDIPACYEAQRRETSTGYQQMLELLQKNKIPYVDGPGLLNAGKKDVSAPLMARCSSHWNNYGAFYSCDRFITVAESLTNSSLGHPIIKNVIINHIPPSYDRELADLMNVIWVPWDYRIIHTTFGNSDSTGVKHKPRLLIEGGSFNWAWLDVMFSSKCITSADFYYYYSKSYGQHFFHDSLHDNIKLDPKIDWAKAVSDIDIVVIEINQSLMHMFPKEFVEEFTNYLEENQNPMNGKSSRLQG